MAALFLCVLLFFSNPALACDSGDRAALIDIQASFEKPNKLSSWNLSTSCCGWYGVLCGEVGTSQRVVGLIFDNKDGPENSLSGSLPDALGDLPFLRVIKFKNHKKLIGEVPTSVVLLQHLRILSLSHNSLTGYLQSFLSQIPSLITLDLSFNNFFGTIPPAISELPVIKEIFLDGNSLEGSIPATFGNFNKSSPPSLHLSKSNLSGKIPPELGVPDWKLLDFSHNNLSGDAKFLFGAKKTAFSINLSFNKFAFNLSPVIFPTSLHYLDMSANKITGSIPAQINQLNNLVNFNVSHNLLCGVIPAGPVMNKFDDTHFSNNKCLYRTKYSCL